MSDSVERWKSELGTLPSQERAELAQFLIESLDPGSDPDAEMDNVWEVELARRVAEIREGIEEGKSADQVFADLRLRFP